MSFAQHVKVEVDVKTGEMPEITAELDERVAIPPINRAVPPVSVFAHAAFPLVAPQKYAVGIEPVCFGRPTVPAATACGVKMVEPEVAPGKVTLEPETPVTVMIPSAWA